MDKDYYHELTSPLWQKKRLEILNRDNFRCQFCGCNDKTLHVHHLKYEKGKKPWEYKNDDLITACSECHNCLTNVNRDLENNIKQLRNDFRDYGFSDMALYFCICALHDYITKDNIHNIDAYNSVRDFIDFAIKLNPYYKDIKALVKLGKIDNELVYKRFPYFSEDYKKTIEDGTQI